MDFFGAIEDLRSPTRDPKAAEFVVLGPEDSTLYYAWGHENIIPWPKVLDKAYLYKEAGGFQQDVTDLSFTKDGLIIEATPDVYKWGRERTRYSLDVKSMVRELLRRGIIGETAPIRIGNWARREGRWVGTARQIAAQQDMPQRLVLFHGTTDFHYENIKEFGLQPVSMEHRIWKDVGGKRGHPLYRGEAAYLTASLDQAEYYARKAVRVLRARGYRGLAPAVLRIQLTSRDYVNLRADDDYLGRRRYQHKVVAEDDWFNSLQEFGQVAFVGTIPPSRIERIA